MGLFEKLFPKTSVNQATEGFFQTLNAYAPVFTTFSGGIYEAEMCRKCIHTFASHASRLNLNVFGDKVKDLQGIFKYQPNKWQTPSQFLYKLATALETTNTAFIIPVLDITGRRIEGIYSASPMQCSVKEYHGQEYLEFRFPTGKATIELDKVGILTKYQLLEDILGGTDHTLDSTIRLLDTINQGMDEGVKASATVRFLARIARVVKPSDLEAARQNFITSNLSRKNNGGVIMYDALIDDVKEINSKPVFVDAEQMKVIQNSVYSHFGINEKILANNFTEEEWNAYYTGKIEPFANQLIEVLQNIFMTERDVLAGCKITAADNRLDHSTNNTKISMVTQLFDRGMLTINEGRQVFGMEAVDDGDKTYIRKEYAETDKLDQAQGLEE